MQAEPFSGVAMPLEVEAVAADPVETGEGRVKLFAGILRETGAVALNEAILGAVPLAEDIDGIVELRRPDGGQETGLQEVVDQVPAGGRHRRFFCCGKAARSHVSSLAYAASARPGMSFRQFQGRSSSSLWTAWSLMRASTSASQACGSTSLSLAVMIKVAMTAARSAPRSDPANSRDLRPRAKPRRARSAALLVKQIRPSSMKRANRSQRLSI